MAFLASRLNRIQPSPTFALIKKAGELKALGRDIINLGVGEPDFNTPIWINEAATDAMNLGMTKYTAVDGTPALKQAIQNKFLRDNNLSYDLDQIMVGTGGKQVLFNALFATIEKDDEVIIPAPYWVSYPEIVSLCGGTPKIISCSESSHFKVTADELRKAITPRTKWLILNSPSNPTGSVYGAAELMELVQVLEENPHVYLLSDDIYEHLIYGDTHFITMASLSECLLKRTLIINGVSKSYSMTGWRIGYGAGPKELISAMTMLQSQSTSNACSISQAAAVAALNGPHDFQKEWREIFKTRRDVTLQALSAIPGISSVVPEGAFYIYVNCEKLMGKKTKQGTMIETDNQFCDYLIEQVGVAVVSGDAFGLSPYFRISYATSLENLTEACARISTAIANLE